MSSGELTPQLLDTSVWDDDMVGAAGIPVVDLPLVTVGGGFGSFALVDSLRIGAVPAASIGVLTNIDRPWQTFEYLAANSQIPRHERLRSDASSVMDNIWGFPSYAVREAWHAKGLRATLWPLWNVLVEPIFADYYTPRAGDVYDGVDREADRIGWYRMLHKGQVRMVRRRSDGGYFTVLTPPAGESATPRVAYRSTFIHLAVGYPGLRFLPDLQEYRHTYSDFSRVVNAYEPHDYVYEELRRRPSTVVLRGSGIVACRVLQRLIEDRDEHGAQTTIRHLFRNYVDGPQGDSATFRRKGDLGFAYQAFNFPKAAGGGQLKDRFEHLDGPGRVAMLGQMGGTNAPKRRVWQAQLHRGLADGFYVQHVGEVEKVVPGPDQTIETHIRNDRGSEVLAANVIIDATGLESDIDEHRVLADLFQHCGASRGAYGRLDVEPSFEVSGTRSGSGRLYASGSMTLGGRYAGVDSFLGLQYAALRIGDDLATIGFGKRIGVRRSVAHWWRRMRDRPVDAGGQGSV